jgi:hypothetical protein
VVTPGTADEGSRFTITGQVSAGSSSTIQRVELWVTGPDTQTNWKKVVTDTRSKGLKTASYSFSHLPGKVGSYWYGVHVTDTRATATEKIPQKITVQTGTGPEVLSLDADPVVIEYWKSNKITISGTVKPGSGADIKKIELMRKDGTDGNWVTKQSSTKKESDFSFTDTINGIPWLFKYQWHYGIKVTDSKNRVARETKPVLVSTPQY